MTQSAQMNDPIGAESAAILIETPAEQAPGRRSPGQAWFRWFARRIGLAALTLWLVSMLVFFATAALGDPVKAILGKSGTPERVAAMRAQLNLDQPLVERYLHWLGGLFTGDLGTSLASQRPVTQMIGNRIVNSAVLVLVAALIMIPLSFGLAMLAARRRGGPIDEGIQLVLLALAALPEFVIGILLLALLSTSLFHIFPAVTISSGGGPWEHPGSMVLPVLTLVCAVTPYITRIVRATLIEVLESDYVELARLKGIPEGIVVRRHALRNAIVPGIQVIGLQLAWLAGGVVVVEYLFSYPGIGQALVGAVQNRDVPIVQALSMLIAAVYVTVNLVADVLSILATPRARTSIS